jgi:uncharacterized protein DUF6585
MFPSPAQRTFRETLTWRVVAALPFLGMLTWGIFDYSDSHAFDPILWSVIAFFGLIFVFACVWAAKRRISIHQEGISYVSLLGEADLGWVEISETRYSHQPINVGAHFGLLGLLINAIATRNSSGERVIRKLKIIGPRTITITSNIKNMEQAVYAVFDAVNPRIRQQAEQVLNTGGTVAFGNVSLSPQGVIWKSKEPIPYTSITKCRIGGGSLQIKAEGKWLNNISVNAGKVPNIFVLLDMVEARRSSLGQKTMAAMAGSSASQYL